MISGFWTPAGENVCSSQNLSNRSFENVCSSQNLKTEALIMYVHPKTLKQKLPECMFVSRTEIEALGMYVSIQLQTDMMILFDLIQCDFS